MAIRIQRLDKRMNGSGRFSHRAIFQGRDLVAIYAGFIKARNWLWSSFGPSSELGTADETFFGEVPQYAWINDDKATVIYLRDEALTQFLLKVESFQ